MHESGETIEFDNPHDYYPAQSTWGKLGTIFTEGATCSEWTKFLRQVFNDDAERIAFIQRAVGYSLTGSIAEQCMFILTGSGANGKSTFLRVLQQLLGDYAGTIPMQGLMEQKYGSQTNDLAHLFGKRLAVASEGENGQRLAESKIKTMTGGDRISCRPLYGNLCSNTYRNLNCGLRRTNFPHYLERMRRFGGTSELSSFRSQFLLNNKIKG